MDQTTTDVRLANWKSIVEQCSSRPEGMSIKQWCSENSISENSTTIGSGRSGLSFSGNCRRHFRLRTQTMRKPLTQCLFRMQSSGQKNF